MENERVYVLSDLHLNLLSPEKRNLLLGFFKSVVSKDATAVYLNGDIVDLMEPEMSDQAMQDIRLLFFLLTSMAEGGIPVHYNLGNHDLPLLLLFPTLRFTTITTSMFLSIANLLKFPQIFSCTTEQFVLMLRKRMSTWNMLTFMT